MVVVILLVCTCMTVAAQEAALFDAAANDDVVSPWWDALERYRESPLCLHMTTAHELATVPGMSPHLAARVLRIAALRPAWDAAEIADSLCLGTAQRLLLMACTTRRCDATTWQGVASGRAVTHAQGVQRISARYGAWRLTMQHAQEGPGAALHGRVLGTDVLLGDIAMRIGTGLVMGTMSPSRGLVGATSVPSDALRMRPWTSTMRTGAIRGIAVQRVDSVGPHALHGMVVAGRQDRGASFGGTEDLTGFALDVACADWHVGASTVSITYDVDVASASARAAFARGGRWTSLFGGLHNDRVEAAFELAVDPRNNIAVVTRARWDGASWRAAATVRHLAAGYRAPYGDAPTDATAAANEAGVSAALVWRPWPSTTLEALIDVRSTLDRTYTVPRTVRGHTMELQAVHRMHGAIWSARLWHDDDDDALRVDGVARSLVARRRRSRLRLEYAWRATSPLVVTLRGEVAHAGWTRWRASVVGAAIMLRCRVPLAAWMDASVQATIYDTPGIDAAVYMAEAPMPDVLRAVPLVGSGVRTVAGVHVRLTAWLDAWVVTTTAPSDRRAEVMFRMRLQGVDVRRGVAAHDQPGTGLE